MGLGPVKRQCQASRSTQRYRYNQISGRVSTVDPTVDTLGAGVSFASVFCAILHTAANHSLIGSVLITRLNNRRKAKHTQSSGLLMLITLTRRCRSFILLGKLQKETQGVSFIRDTGKEKGLNACTVASRNHRALGILRNPLLITSLKKPLASRNSTLLCRCHYILK